jgi:glycosyltransferase involved in cell wall biosynthesis
MIAVNEHIKDELCKSYAMPERKIRVIVNGVPTSDIVSKDIAKKRLGLLENKLLIFSACRLIPRKRIDILIKAVKILSENGVKNFSVVICGDGPQKHFLLRLVDKYDLSNKIRFLGWVSEEELQLHYEAADIFVLTSEYEGFPISLLEALAYGAAPVCSNISPMIITEDVNGLIFTSKARNNLLKRSNY